MILRAQFVEKVLKNEDLQDCCGSVSAHNISKVLIKLFHRAVRGSVLLKHSGHALCCRSITRCGSANIKVLVELFQQLAGSRGRALAALRRVRKAPALGAPQGSPK